MDIIVKGSVNGNGLFAARDFAPGEDLYEVIGEFISGDAEDDIDATTRNNTFRYDEDRYISPRGSIGDMQNHSCAPNAKVVKRGDRLYVVAAAPIANGDELLIDYSTILASDDIWEMECACGSSICRGIVRRFERLPKRLQERYKKTGMVPAYILEI